MRKQAAGRARFEAMVERRSREDRKAARKAAKTAEAVRDAPPQTNPPQEGKR